MMEDYVGFVEADVLLRENSKEPNSVELSFVSNTHKTTHTHTLFTYAQNISVKIH